MIMSQNTTTSLPNDALCKNEDSNVPILKHENSKIEIRDFRNCKYGTLYKLLRSTRRGTQYVWVIKCRIKMPGLLKKFEERVRKDFGYSVEVENNNNTNDYNNRPRRSEKLCAMTKLKSSEEYKAELYSSNEEYEKTIKNRKRKKRRQYLKRLKTKTSSCDQ